ncbi:hypothetical protein LTR10_015829 [Elasticomyces elasticus]|uniref:Uncharacterized protein n=1 Tax=Exophiala sideris TaxID=1016849 RepID=A0A0D1Z7J3_9EURO|nr:hypothetical protein LTR10_015829 [Elasticomyces elasticus]KAK5022499.1 hypothetical protein LTS07_009945 [Exophiala sideris]KAK5177900.1 hypothetical protein LTR44_009665 [Eurotiomycetes sp. CCFEE 6388]KAK5028027.1 hypothetical protein LTR13_009256 [Exophiala sideris]KAK5051768.1 hypothetical protein LTR69_010059 [Exophiala sideris]
MQTRTIVALSGVGAVAALAITQLSMQSQNRQYKKTLAYMHDGRDKFAEKMNKLAGADKK